MAKHVATPLDAMQRAAGGLEATFCRTADGSDLSLAYHWLTEVAFGHVSRAAANIVPL